MPWSKGDYPDSMKNLPTPVRNKAVEIANALLKDGRDEGEAIRIGIAQAKKSVGHKKEAHSIEGGLAKVAYDFANRP